MDEASGSPVRILLVEDHAAFREALAMIFSLDPSFQVVGEAGSLAEARQRLDGVDVAVFDLDLPDGRGIALIPELHARNQRAEALILTASVRQTDLGHAIEAGAAGLVHKSAPLAEIVQAVRRVAAGESLVPRRELMELVRITRQQREAERATEQIIARLTPRERDVLLALGEGLSDQEIAQRLFVGKATIHTHVANLLGKLGVESRIQALLFAIRSGLVRFD